MTVMTSKIAKHNDELRRNMVGCKVMFTPGVRALPQIDFNALVECVRRFDLFTEDNDPRGEHDFGKIRLEGVDYFWKFDYYDDDYKYFQLDGNRVLTIMRADEY